MNKVYVHFSIAAGNSDAYENIIFIPLLRDCKTIVAVIPAIVKCSWKSYTKDLIMNKLLSTPVCKHYVLGSYSSNK